MCEAYKLQRESSKQNLRCCITWAIHQKESKETAFQGKKDKVGVESLPCTQQTVVQFFGKTYFVFYKKKLISRCNDTSGKQFFNNVKKNLICLN